MKITISYDSSWRNSFLDGSNNEPLPEKDKQAGGRRYIASMTSLKKDKDKETGVSKNFIQRSITKDTVMGVLNRLIGDQRKLYQSRDNNKDKNYYFADIEDKVSFIDNPQLTQEMTYLRNMRGSYDQNSFVGSIKVNHPLIDSDFSGSLWGVLQLNISELFEFILDENKIVPNMNNINPFTIIEIIKGFKNINKTKMQDTIALEKVVDKLNNSSSLSQELKNMYPNMQKAFDGGAYLKGDLVQIGSLYCSALYLQVLRLSKKYDMSEIILKGISVNNITPKNFLELFTGGQKRIWGNPYYHDSYIPGPGKVRNLMTKASGKLDIMLDISEEEAKEIRTMIYDAGVSSFYLGKKGLAFVDGDISIKEIVK
ncbi:FIG00921294: hypothetical protein [uncultured Candidatus Thioglobus sp.]|nr:FIG00921294: hypothetical protein [uncultured Candidatus Thioglobus sp.]